MLEVVLLGELLKSHLIPNAERPAHLTDGIAICSPHLFPWDSTHPGDTWYPPSLPTEDLIIQPEMPFWGERTKSESHPKQVRG
jgi:hypothetical protein